MLELNLEDDIFANLKNVTFNLEELDETDLGARFDELVAIAAEQPEEELVFNSLRSLIASSYERGEFEMVQQMAMTLGAMACLDSHFEDLAEQISNLTESHNKNDGHGHQDDEPKNHNSKHCKNCSAKKFCRYRA